MRTPIPAFLSFTMSTCLRCGEQKFVKVTLITRNDKHEWHYECKKCGLISVVIDK